MPAEQPPFDNPDLNHVTYPADSEAAALLHPDAALQKRLEKYQILDSEHILHTVKALSQRIDERFPNSGLHMLSLRLLAIAKQAQARAKAITRPVRWIRLLSWSLVALIALGLVGSIINFEMPQEKIPLFELVYLLEAGLNDIVLIFAGIFFLMSFENRHKRQRALDALHELRALAHVVDMHQLTKDPERILNKHHRHTPSSPTHNQRQWSAFTLSRYLDYCSEMLALTGKIAALYIQHFDDAVVLSSVNEIESLTTGLSRKIWQKLIIVHPQVFEEQESEAQGNKQGGKLEATPPSPLKP